MAIVRRADAGDDAAKWIFGKPARHVRPQYPTFAGDDKDQTLVSAMCADEKTLKRTIGFRFPQAM